MKVTSTFFQISSRSSWGGLKKGFCNFGIYLNLVTMKLTLIWILHQKWQIKKSNIDSKNSKWVTQVLPWKFHRKQIYTRRDALKKGKNSKCVTQASIKNFLGCWSLQFSFKINYDAFSGLRHFMLTAVLVLGLLNSLWHLIGLQK